VGCSADRHLAHLHDAGFSRLSGVEVNPEAFAVMRETHPALAADGVNGVADVPLPTAAGTTSSPTSASSGRLPSRVSVEAAAPRGVVTGGRRSSRTPRGLFDVELDLRPLGQVLAADVLQVKGHVVVSVLRLDESVAAGVAEETDSSGCYCTLTEVGPAGDARELIKNSERTCLRDARRAERSNGAVDRRRCRVRRSAPSIRA
jgi:hypothetical protein